MGNHYGVTRTNKPCQKCGRMMYNVPIARKCCNVCTYGFPWRRKTDDTVSWNLQVPLVWRII